VIVAAWARCPWVLRPDGFQVRPGSPLRMSSATVETVDAIILGHYDLVSIIDAPSEEAMMGAMANVVAAGNVSSTTMRAFDDKEMEGILKKV
jgi:uncharacterized protein with GYD domain